LVRTESDITEKLLTAEQLQERHQQLSNSVNDLHKFPFKAHVYVLIPKCNKEDIRHHIDLKWVTSQEPNHTPNRVIFHCRDLTKVKTSNVTTNLFLMDKRIQTLFNA